MENASEKTFSFGNFELDAGRRRLLKEGKIIALNSKSFDLLLTLVENHGQILSKDELLEKVWEGQFVEENNLSVQIAALRKIFGEKKGEHQFIATVPGKGYKFVAETRISGGEKAVPVRAELVPNGIYEAETLVGREREITEIINLLRGDAANLITLTGAGGSGKTRIARAIAEKAAADFPDGVFFVELAAVSDAALVAAEIANALGIKESGGAELVETVQDFLRERRALLILDNFEQLISAASVINEISVAAPRLKILTTSRVALSTKNEREFVVAPLVLPPHDEAISADKLAGYAAAALFIQRAQGAKPNFVLTNENAPVVARICRRLDGLPLAIELAAARIKLLSPQAIFDRLENSLKLLTSGDKNLPSRQRTMRETIQWSYELLAEDERILFRRLAVFAGSFSVEAAETVVSDRWSVVSKNPVESKEDAVVVNDDQSPITDHRPLTTALDLLTSLVDNNLLRVTDQNDGGARLQMLEVVREFAAECLKASDEQGALEQNHAEFFRALAEEAEPHLTGEQAVVWLEKLETEIDNFRAALRRSLKTDTETTIRMAGALRYLWIYHSHLTEGAGWLKAALGLSDDAPSNLRFKLLHGLGLVNRIQGDYEAARKLYQKALDEGIAVGDKRQIALTNTGLGAILHSQGNFAAARKYFEDGLAVSRELNDDFSIAYALVCLGIVVGIEGKPAEARKLLEESLSILRRIGSKESVSNNLNNLGAVAFDEGDYEAAHNYFTEGLALSREVGNKVNITDALNGFGALAEQRKEPELAAKLAGAAETLGNSVGYNKEPTEQLFCETYIAKIRAALDEKSFAAAFEEGQSMTLTEAIALTKFQLLEKSDKSANVNPQTEIFNGFAVQPTDIIIENRSISRIVIEEAEEKRNGREEKRKSNSLKNFLFSFSPLLLFLILAAIGGYVWLNRRTFFSSAAPFANNSIRQLTTNGKVGLAALSSDGKLFAYTTDDTGQKSLWLGFVNGGNHLPLRPPAAAVYRTLAFSPDSNYLYFSVLDEQDPKSALYKMPVGGGVPVKVLDEIGHFALSPDGNRIAIARRDDAAGKDFLVVAALDGSERRDAASFPKEFSFFFETISWSADGKRFAVSAIKDSKIFQHEIAVVNVVTGGIERISPPPLREITKTAWLGDGSGLIVTAIEHDSHASVPQYLIYHVAYPSGETSAITADRSNYGASWHNDAGASLGVSAANDSLLAVEHRQLSNVWVAPTEDLSAARQITFSSFGKYDGLWGLDWTPDGRLIYTTSDTRSQYLSKMNQDGGEQQSLTAPGAVDSVLTVSNDGRYVVFHSNRGGDFDIWRMDTDGANMKQLTFGGKAFHPAPSPDGRWVYYKSWLKNVGELCRVPTQGGEPECLNDKSTSWGSFSPDGKFFAASYVTDKARLAIFSAETNALVRQFELPKSGTLYMGSRWSPDSRAVVYRDTAFGYWKQSVEGGEPERLEGLPKEKFYNFAFSKDGKQFAFVRGTEIRDVVLITNNK